MTEEEPMQEENREDELAEQAIEITAPIFPWEIVLRQSVTYFQAKPSGGMQMKFAPAVRGQAGRAQPMPPGFVLDFNAEGWKTFQETVANDGVPPAAPPTIETARVIPPDGFPPRISG